MSPSVRRFDPFFVTVIAVLAAGIALAYARSLNVGFYFDDSLGIANNTSIRSLRNIPSFFTDPFALWVDTSAPDLRPLLLASFALNYAISGLEPWSYHLLNLGLHFTSAVLVFVIARDHLGWDSARFGPFERACLPAAATALFFAFAPLNSQPVVYVWARSALMCVTFYLGAFLGFQRQRWVIGAALLAAALLTKVIAVTLPAVLLAHAWVFGTWPGEGTPIHRFWKTLPKAVLVSGAVVAAYLVYRNLVLPSWTADTRPEAGITPLIWFVSQWPALLYYVRLFLWPDTLSVDHDFPFSYSPFEPRAWASLVVIVVWLAVAFSARKRLPQLAFGTLWFFLTLAPESSFAPLAEVINEHRPYIASSLGLAVILSVALDRMSAFFGNSSTRAFAGGTAALVAMALPVIHQRTSEWQSALHLWEATVRTSPSNGRAWMNAGGIHMAEGRLDKARSYFERARELAPNYAYVYMNLSVLNAHENRMDEARTQAEMAIQLQPQNAQAHYYLGRVLEKQGDAPGALAAYRLAQTLNPKNQDVTAALQALEAAQGSSEQDALMKAGLEALYTLNDPSRAAQTFRVVLDKNPEHYGATFQLATALDRQGLRDQATPLWERVVVLAKQYGDQETLRAAYARLAAPN